MTLERDEHHHGAARRHLRVGVFVVEGADDDVAEDARARLAALGL